MKNYILYLFLLLVTMSFGQTPIHAHKKQVSGILLYEFSPHPTSKELYCLLNTKLLIDTVAYDFLPQNIFNYHIIKEHSELEKQLGPADIYFNEDIITNICTYLPNDERYITYNCDSVMNHFKENIVYDTLLYKPNSEKYRILEISSTALYTQKNTNHTYIAMQFMGSVIQYNDLDLTESNIEEIATHYSPCADPRYDSTLLVLHKTRELLPITKAMQHQLQLDAAAFTKIAIAL